MRKIIVAGVSALCLLTACGVDKEGTGDKLVEDIEEAAGIDLSSEQQDCLKDLVKDMSDDEITDISENEASQEVLTEFQQNVSTCIGDAVTPVETEVETEETVGS